MSPALAFGTATRSSPRYTSTCTTFARLAPPVELSTATEWPGATLPRVIRPMEMVPV